MLFFSLAMNCAEARLVFYPEMRNGKTRKGNYQNILVRVEMEEKEVLVRGSNCAARSSVALESVFVQTFPFSLTDCF
ncbi:MAG: hypothetical protein BGO78_12925 [Chloroflexi bacterium 44-23]|nr:MAG: hypothetical protein BGO78_12925 [Chloroflexi bacterium 44-23]